MAFDHWQYQDPAKHVKFDSEKKHQKPRLSKSQRAKQELEKLFESKEESVARLLSLPKEVVQACHQWGEWVARPQFWTDLRATPFYKLIPITRHGSKHPSEYIKLDPRSIAIHASFHRLQDERTQAVLYLYYVLKLGFNDLNKKELDIIKMSKSAFYERLNKGSLMIYNSSK